MDVEPIPSPIEAHASPVPDQLWSGLRTIAVAGTTFALGRGWIQDDMAALLLAIAGVMWPIIAEQLKVRRRAQEKAVLACSVPDHIGVVK